MDRRKAKSRKIEKVMATSTTPQWIDLPGDVTANILQRLGAVEILENAQNVCTTWRRICLQDPSMWRVIHMRLTDWRMPITCRRAVYRRAVIMCFRAVDLSQGQLVDLTIQNFGDDNLLNYIVDRSSDLRRLTLHCGFISGKGVAEAAIKLRHLEELHLIVTELVKASDVETIGISCPKLKSFTIKQNLYGWTMLNPNKIALAIAKNMPNLCHLRLISQWMTKEGLEAILDGCPKLESLDLRQCFNLELRGALGKRCYEQIKDFKCPDDPINDD